MIIAVAAALAVGIEGQELEATTVTPAAAKRATTATTAGATHTILVGAEGFKFSPNQYTNVPIGDIIGA